MSDEEVRWKEIGRGVSYKNFMIPKYITSKKMSKKNFFLNLFSLILSFIAESEVP